MFQKIKYILIAILIIATQYQIALANTWYFTTSNHNTLTGYRWLTNPYTGTANTYSVTGNFTGERRFANGTTSNRWATTVFPSNVTLPAGTWSFAIYGNTTNRRWFPRIKIYDSAGTLIYTTTSPTAITSATYTTVTWTDTIPSFSVGTGNFYAVEVWVYRTQTGNTTHNFRINNPINYIIDTYVPPVYQPQSKGWRFYDDAPSLNPGTAYSGENSPPIEIYNQNNLRLRLTLAEIGGLSQTGRKKLQYSTDGINFTDLGEIGSGAIWRYCDGGGTDDQLTSQLLISSSTSFGPFVESGTAASTYNHPALSNAEFDFCLQNNNASPNTIYYFRVYDVASNQPAPAFSGYNFPSLTTSTYNLNLSISASFNLNTINMNDAPGPTTGTFNNLIIKDFRGNAPGWTVTATGTDFSDGLGNSIPITNLTMTSQNIAPLYAESTAGIILNGGSLSTTIPINLASATTGNGAGNFTVSGNFSLNIPIATVPGTYSSIITITIS